MLFLNTVLIKMNIVAVADISQEPFNEELDTRASGEDAQEALNNEDSDDREASSRMQSAEVDEQQQQEQQQQFETEEGQEDESNSKEVSGDAEESRNKMSENTSRGRCLSMPMALRRLVALRRAYVPDILFYLSYLCNDC